MYCHPGYGPTFGYGYDIYISNDSNVFNDNISNLSSYEQP